MKKKKCIKTKHEKRKIMRKNCSEIHVISSIFNGMLWEEGRGRVWKEDEGEKMITFVEIVKGNPGGSNNNNNNNTATCYLMITQNVTKQKKKNMK